jgi:hypothetical protein
VSSGFPKKALIGAGVLLALLVLAGAVLVFALTREIDPEWTHAPTKAELPEANRKLRLFTKARTDGTKGYIRLSEVEINSLLEDQLATSRTNSPGFPEDLLHAGVSLTRTNISWYYWEKKRLAGLPLPFSWQRVTSPTKSASGWDFPVAQMYVGAVKLPVRCWQWADWFLGSPDGLFEERKSWLAHLPWMELTAGESTEATELKLYTYVPTKKSARATTHRSAPKPK